MQHDAHSAAMALLQQSQRLYSAQDVQHAIQRMATEIHHDLHDSAPLLLTVMGGAVFFAGQLMAQLDFPLQLDYVQATRYGQQTQGSQLVWKVDPPVEVNQRVVLILDDILDQGITLQAIQARCLAMGAKQVKIAVLFEKMLAQEKPVRADYVGLSLPDHYVFGCGMDVYGWWRNLPEVRALSPDQAT